MSIGFMYALSNSCLIDMVGFDTIMELATLLMSLGEVSRSRFDSGDAFDFLLSCVYDR